MKAFLAMLTASVTMLRRNRVLLITSLGLALISILVFGWLFGSSGSPKLVLGVVDQDNSAVAAQVIGGLRQSASLDVRTGSQGEELQALRDGNRNAVIALAPGFGAALAHGHAGLQVYYDQSNPVTQAAARMAVQSIVTGINQQLVGQPSPIMIQEQAVSVHTLRQIDWLTPGMLGNMLMWANLGVGGALVLWRRQGTMRRLAATPLQPGTLISAQVAARLIISMAQAAALVAIAMLVFNVQVIGSWAALAVAVTLGALAMLSIGFAIGSFAATPDVATAVTFLISFPMMFLSGSYFPTNNAPPFLTPVIKALPLSYLNDALRQIMNNGAGFAAVRTDLLVLVAWMVAALLVSVRAFRWS